MLARNEIQLSTIKHAYRPRPRAFNYLLGTVFADTSRRGGLRGRRHGT